MSEPGFNVKIDWMGLGDLGSFSSLCLYNTIAER